MLDVYIVYTPLENILIGSEELSCDPAASLAAAVTTTEIAFGHLSMRLVDA
jgi:hypothetical protein